MRPSHRLIFPKGPPFRHRNERPGGGQSEEDQPDQHMEGTPSEAKPASKKFINLAQLFPLE